MASYTVAFTLDGTPPSLNKHMYANWRRTHKVKKEWQSLFGWALSLSPLTKIPVRIEQAIGPVEHLLKRAIYVEATLGFSVQRRRDEGNYRWIIEKALGDALVAGGYLVDDTGDEFSVGRVSVSPLRASPPGHTSVFLHVSEVDNPS